MSNYSSDSEETTHSPHPLSLARVWDPNYWILSTAGLSSSMQSISSEWVESGAPGVLTCGMEFWSECHQYKQEHPEWFCLEKISGFLLEFIQKPSLWFYKIDKVRYSMAHMPLWWALIHALHEKFPIKVQHVFLMGSEPERVNHPPFFELTNLKEYVDSIPAHQRRFFFVIQFPNAFRKNAIEEIMLMADVLPLGEEWSLQQCALLSSPNSVWIMKHLSLDQEDPSNFSSDHLTGLMNARSEEIDRVWKNASFRLFRVRHWMTRQLDGLIESYATLSREKDIRDADADQLLQNLIVLEQIFRQTTHWLESRRYLSNRANAVWEMRRWSRQRFNGLTRLLIERLYFSDQENIRNKNMMSLIPQYQTIAELLR